MAKETNVDLWIGSDHQFAFHLKNAAETAAVDITGWALSWMVKSDLADADGAALLTKTTAGGGIAIAGTFNSDPALNTQRATVTVNDTDTDALSGVKWYELKRTDNSSETVLAYGKLTLLRGVHRA